MKEPRIIYNAIKTPDGTILESNGRHDYHIYRDTVDGMTYAVDGGHDYIRRGGEGNAEELSIIDDGSLPIEKVREYLKWGTYGKEGLDPLSYVLIKDMDDDHIENVLNDIKAGADTLRKEAPDEYARRIETFDYYTLRLTQELQYRKDHENQH